MGLMTICTAHLIHQRPVYPVFIEGLIHHGAMASPAQLKSRLSGIERGGGSCSFVALAAHFLCHRCMDVVIEHSRGAGAMGVMAGGTGCLCHRIVHVLLDKNGAVGFMALQTKSNGIFFQKMIGFDRGVWVMAVDAPFLYGTMLEFQLG